MFTSPVTEYESFNNVLSKSQEFFSWVEKSDPMVRVPHLVKEDCSCENCFQVNSQFKGTIEKANENCGC